MLGQSHGMPVSDPARQPSGQTPLRSRQGNRRYKINQPALYPCEEFATWTDLIVSSGIEPLLRKLEKRY